MSDARSEEPTPKRLRRAREEGDSGASPYASQAVGLAVAALLVPVSIAAVAERVGSRLREAIAAAASVSSSGTFDARRAAADVLWLSLPILVAVAVAAVAAQLVQTGGAVATRRIGPRLARLNAREGIKTLVTRARLFAIGRALVGAALVVGVVGHTLRSHAADLARVAGRFAYVGPVAGALAGALAWKVALAGLGLGALDVAFARMEWRRRLRMSRGEVKREQKESEGDPEIKQARERARTDLMGAAPIAAVRGASVVVVGAPHLACALRYERQHDAAPYVVASGEGEPATQITELARRHEVPIVRDDSMAEALLALGSGEVIPEPLYDRVAEILRDTRVV